MGFVEFGCILLENERKCRRSDRVFETSFGFFATVSCLYICLVDRTLVSSSVLPRICGVVVGYLLL